LEIMKPRDTGKKSLLIFQAMNGRYLKFIKLWITEYVIARFNIKITE